MEDHTAQKLHVVGPLAQGAPGRFPGQGEGLGEELVEGLALVEPVAEGLGQARKFLGLEGHRPGFLGVDLVQDGKELFQVPLEFGSEKGGQEVHSTNVEEDPPGVNGSFAPQQILVF